jgi:nucleoid-associated protein EbfC
MQDQVASVQQELAEATVDGTVGDGLVTVTVNGTGELVGVKIRRDSFDPSEPEDLEDLIVAAYRDAAARAQAMASEKLGPITGALGGEPGAGGGSGLPLGF